MNNCPKCNANWIGGEIPENIREHYSPPYVWKREIGIDGGFIGIYDGIVALQCPDCKDYMPRGSSKWAKDLFNKFMEYKANVEEKNKKA